MPGWLGWAKYEVIAKSGYTGNILVHYVGNRWLKWFSIWFDFKIK
ncbi:MAG: hypothetical protein PHR96_03100 [Clostridia bacterium]|nr:hypothetical protein [Clostridia bacterium]